MRFGRDAGKVVMGLVTNYDFEKIAPFLNSLAATEYDGCVVLYVHNLSYATLRAVQSYGVETRPAAAFLSRHLDQQLTRYLMYFDFLTEYSHSLKFVMFSDVRDVVFQADPSVIPPSRTPAFHVFLESSRLSIEQEASNRRWLHNAYGSGVASVIGAMPICCSGITMGDHVGMLAYNGLMIDEMRRQSGGMRIKGVDQGIHNFLLWMRRPALAVVHENGDHVLTLGVGAEGSHEIVGDLIAAPAGHIPAIIHQWDRHQDLISHVERKYGTRPLYPEAVATHEGKGVVVGYVSKTANRDGIFAFLASQRQAGFVGQIMLGVTEDLAQDRAIDISDLARRFDATLVVTPPASKEARFHQDLAFLVKLLPQASRLVCVDAGSTIFLNEPFKARMSGLMCVALGQRNRLGQFPRLMKALAKLAAASDLSGKFVPSPRFFMGHAGDILGALEKINHILNANSGWAEDVVGEVAAVSHVIYRELDPAAEVLPNFSLVANLSGLDDSIVSLDATALFPERHCSIVLDADRSIKLGAVKNALSTALSLPDTK